MPQIDPKTLVTGGVDPALKVYEDSLVNIPTFLIQPNIYITNVQETVVEYINTGGQTEISGNSTEVQFNQNHHLSADSHFRFDPITDVLTVVGNIEASKIKTDYLLHSNGVAWSFVSSGDYNDLTNKPNLAIYATSTYVDNKFANISYANLSGAPNIANYATTANLSILNNTVANISYANLVGAPNIANYATNANLSSLSNVVANINWSNLSGKPTFVSNLDSLSDVVITSATNGQVLKYDGTNWVNGTDNTGGGGSTPAGSNTQIQFNDGGSFGASSNLTYNKSTGQVHISTTTSSPTTNGYAGALVVEGGIAAKGNIHMLHGIVHNQLYVGNNAGLTSFTNPTLIIKDTGVNYIQAAVVNAEGNASSDWVAYGDNGDDTQAWSDFGFTGTTFNDPAYTITKPNDGYFFVQGAAGQGGNLILATGDQGSGGDMIFALGGFSSNNEVLRITHDTKALEFTSNAKISTNGHTWNFNTTGNLVLPSNTSHINYANGTSILAGLGASGNPFDQDLNTTNSVTFSDVTSSSFNFPNAGGVSEQTGNPVDGNPNTRYDIQILAESNVVLQTNEGEYQWILGRDGSIQFPNGAKLNNGTANQFATDNTVTTSLDLRDTHGAGFYTNNDGVTLRSNGSHNWYFGTDGITSVPGAINQGWNNHTKTSGYQGIRHGQTTDIWVASTAEVTSAKFTIQFESRISGGNYYENFDTLTCEIVMAKRIVDGTWRDVPITVYAIVHTSTTPLVTFGSRIDTGTGKAILTCTPDASITDWSYLKVHSVEMQSSTIQNNWC